MAILPGIIVFLHDLFTAVWIGGLFFLVAVLMPIVRKKQSEDIKKYMLFSLELQKRLRIFVGISIVGLWITGLMLTQNSGAGGFLKFATPYQIVLSLKHIAIFGMVAMVVWRSLILAKMSKQPSKDSPNPMNIQQKMRFSMIPVIINLILGIVVLLLTGILTVV